MVISWSWMWSGFVTSRKWWKQMQHVCFPKKRHSWKKTKDLEALGHLQQILGPHPKSSKTERLQQCCVAVAENSYHGPPTTALGQPALAQWPKAPRSSGQVTYPLPPLGDDKAKCEKYLVDFETFLMEHPEIGVFVFEPQWGSSRLGRTWPRDLLREVIARCKRFGAYVLCDEIMCGLGGAGFFAFSLTVKAKPDSCQMLDLRAWKDACFIAFHGPHPWLVFFFFASKVSLLFCRVLVVPVIPFFANHITST